MAYQRKQGEKTKTSKKVRRLEAVRRDLPVAANPFKDPDRPALLPLLVNLSRPAFPGMTVGLEAEGSESRAIKVAEKKFDGRMGLFLLKDRESADREHPHRHELYLIGTLGRLQLKREDKPDVVRCVIQSQCRLRLRRVFCQDGVVYGEVEYPEDILPSNKGEQREADGVADIICHLLMDMSEELNLSDDVKTKVLSGLNQFEYGTLAEVTTASCSASPDEGQAVLETLNIRERLEKALFLLKRHHDDQKLRKKLMHRVESRMDKNHRTFMMQELIRETRRELGQELDSKEGDLDRLTERLEEIRSALNPEAAQKIEEELSKLRATNSQSPDYTICKNYLDWMTGMPWNVTTEDRLDVKKARDILERDHFGLEDVKKRILEFIAVASLKGKVDGSIICLLGPPGTGKTSLGHSIAEALGRKFFRFSLGGMRDEAEIKGHRRTYIGAQPGKIVSALKTCGSCNPVIMLDELDKLDSTNRGDPASALLEVLDPEQNRTFRDHFLDIPFDLSKVLFIATANVRDTIPAPLQDRMEIITLSGYITEEKLSIAKRHLIPKLLPRNGLKAKNIAFSEKALRSIIDGYARDSGCRNLEKSIGTCMRKVATQIADGTVAAGERVSVLPKDVEKYLGKPVFYDDPLVRETIPGVVMGLAWTAVGGSTLYIEVLPTKDKPAVTLTGQLGNVMQESAQIAKSLVESRSRDYGIAADFFSKHKLHIHVPAGATPKDGPSAGITMATAIISAATGRKLPPGWAMTGELTLTGRVLPVGGIKEKMIAARRAGVTDVILPRENEKDFLEIQDRARQGLTAHYVSEYNQVFQLVLNRPSQG
ncbi:MAG: endopeptidase La [Victivallales bacterium]|nr:endopeptidase La [Victivallales bacterium]